MEIGMCSIQRNRGKWLKEWIIFHHLVGVTKFYIYLHKCTDNSSAIIIDLQKYFNIQCFLIDDETGRPQLVAYEHAYQNFGHEIDWMAFIDGDEFLFPSFANTLNEVLAKYQYEKLSALGVYWHCFGSSGHIKDPDGLIIEDYQFRANSEFPGNCHIKSIVKGGQGVHCFSAGNAHLFNTIYGTFDELMRPLTKGLVDTNPPSFNLLRINHYATQSHDFYTQFKKHSGAADSNKSHIREESWWKMYDRNEEKDTIILRFKPALLRIILNCI